MNCQLISYTNPADLLDMPLEMSGFVLQAPLQNSLTYEDYYQIFTHAYVKAISNREKEGLHDDVVKNI